MARASIWVQPAKEATSSIPIVFLTDADPVGAGHVASLARPGANITGLAVLMTDLAPTVEQSTKFKFVINLKIAKVLGLTIPPSLLQREDEIIQ